MTKKHLLLTLLLLITLGFTGCFSLIKPDEQIDNPIDDPILEPTALFVETFDNVPDGTNIRPGSESGRTELLDNPNSFLRNNISGTITANNGAIAMGTQRMAVIIPGLAAAENPVLRLTIKNDNDSGNPVSNLKLVVGDTYSTSGAVGVSGQRAHGEYLINHSDYQVLEITLNPEFIGTNLLCFRGIVGSSGTAGLFIDKIEVYTGNVTIPPDDDHGNSDPPVEDDDPGIPPGEITPPPVTIGDAYFGLVGWAGENGGTTGGEGCPEEKILYIDNGRDLYDALYANERRHKGDKSYGEPYPLIIYITGKIIPANTGEDKIDLKDQADVSIIGVDNFGEFDGIGITVRRAENIIFRNLTIHHVNIGDKKALDITTESKNIWVDRCTFYSDLDLDHGKDYYDGLLDIKEKAEYVTVSWCKFYDHYKTSLVGHTDDANKAPDKVTYHHNYFYNVNSRTPLIRYAEVHLFNNYFHNISGSGINVRMGGKARIENNYFENVGSGSKDKTGYIEGPIGWWFTSPETGYWEVIDNVFVNNPVNTYESTTNVSIPYNYGMALNTAERAKELVLQYAGASSPSL